MKIGWWPAGRGRVNRLAREMAVLREQVEAAREGVRMREEECRSLRSRADRAEEEVGTLREALARATERLEDGRSARDAADRRHEATDRELASLRAASERGERRHTLHVEETEKLVAALAERIEQARLAFLRRG